MILVVVKPIGLDLLAICLIRMLEFFVKYAVAFFLTTDAKTNVRNMATDLHNTALLDGHPVKYISRIGLVQNLGDGAMNGSYPQIKCDCCHTSCKKKKKKKKIGAFDLSVPLFAKLPDYKCIITTLQIL